MEDIYKRVKNFKQEYVSVFDLAEFATFHLFKIRKEYTIDCLAEVEKQIDEHFPLGHKVFNVTTYIPFGWYFGKVIIENIKGSYWIGDIKDPIDLKIHVPTNLPNGRMIIFPFKRVMNFWEDRTDGMVPFFHMIDYLNKHGMPAPNEIDNEGWIEKDGFKMRFRKEWCNLFQ